MNPASENREKKALGAKKLSFITFLSVLLFFMP